MALKNACSSTLSGITIGTADLDDDAVTLAKLVNITRGSILVGGASNAPTELVAKGSAKLLQGDGTDLASVTVSGDVTIAAGGAVTIASGAVTSAKILDGTIVGADCSTVMATKALAVILPTITTTGAVEITVPAPCAGTLVAAVFTDKDALAQHASNYLTFTLTNKGQGGAGTAVMLAATDANTTKTSTGSAIGAYTPRILTLSGTGANLVVAANDCLVFTVTPTGTLANTCTEGTLRLDFQVTT